MTLSKNRKFIVKGCASPTLGVKKLPARYKRRISRAINALAFDPYPPKSTELGGQYKGRNLFRIWVDNWRIVYHVDEQEKVVTIKRVAPSRTYKNL